MRKIIFIFLMLSIAGFSLAQDKKFNTSIQAGSIISNFTNKIGYYGDSHSQYFNGAMRLGYNAGINLKYDIIKNAEIGIDLLYMNCGSRYVSVSDYSEGIRHATELHYWDSEKNRSVKSYILNYLEIPMFVSFNVKTRDSYEFSVYGGYGFFVNLNSEFRYIHWKNTNYEWVDTHERLVERYSKKILFNPANKTNNSLFLGTGFYNKDSRMGFNARVELLFSDIYKESSMTIERLIFSDPFYPVDGVLETVQSNMKTKLLVVSFSIYRRIFN
jgi:hypothetical protein